MDILSEHKGDIAIVSVSVPELDAGNVDDFKRSLAQLLESSTWLVMDLKHLQFIDSSGLGAILSCLRQLTAKGGDLKLSGMTPQVRSAFELVRMHRIFDIFDNAGEAVAAFANLNRETRHGCADTPR
jgi:anti-sigma B factor antagonist